MGSSRSKHSDTHPARPCPFCHKFIKRLTIHLKVVHKDEELVHKAKNTSSKESHKIFKQLKRTGIMAYNITKMGEKNLTLLSKRRVQNGGPRKDGVVCDQCSGIFDRRKFYVHKRNCTVEGTYVPQPIPLYLYEQNPATNDEFATKILARFINDEIGVLCRSDEHILAIGRRLYEKRQAKKDKKTEVKRSVMSDMRRLATLYMNFRNAGRKVQVDNGNLSPVNLQFADMFNRSNFTILESAVKECTVRLDESMKSGLKIALFYLMKKAAKILKVAYLVKMNDASAAEVGMFVEVLNMNFNFLFGDAIYNLNTAVKTKLRKPSELRLQSEIDALRSYSICRITAMIDDPYTSWTGHEFAELRDLAAA